MSASPYVVTPSGDLRPPRRTLSPRRLVSGWRQLLNPLGSFDPTTIRFDAHAIDAELMERFARGGQRSVSAGVEPFTRSYS